LSVGLSFLEIKKYHHLVVIESSIMGDARSDNVLSETSTNEDGFELLKKIEKNTKNVLQFEKPVFPSNIICL
jgi:hypothetical protein